MNQRYIWNVEQRMTSQQYDALNRFGRLLAKLLFVRGVRTEQQGMAMIKDVGSKYDPYQMKNMKKVVLEIKEAIKNQKRITIFGDYDADGVIESFTFTFRYDNQNRVSAILSNDGFSTFTL